MNAVISEHRIMDNQVRRRRELRRHISFFLLTLVLAVTFSTLFFTVRIWAQSRREAAAFKYYKSVMVETGDSLWNYASQYGDSAHYEKSEDYIKEVMDINFLTDEEITAGQYIIIPYYSPESL